MCPFGFAANAKSRLRGVCAADRLVTGGAQAGRQRVLGIERQQRGGGLQLVLAGVVTNDLPLLQRGVQAGQQRQSARAGQGAQRGGVVGRQHAGIKGMGAFQCLQHK